MKKNVKSSRLDQSGVVSLIFIVLIILLLIMGAGIYVWKKNATKPNVTSKTDTSTKPTSTPAVDDKKLATKPTPSACKDPSSTVIENIKASVTSGNTAALEGYMAPTVKVIVAASEGIGDQTPAHAVKDVTDFIGDPTTTTWDFALPAATLEAYGKGDYKTYFPSNAVVGKSNTKHVISFNFDCDGKINTVFEATDASLL